MKDDSANLNRTLVKASYIADNSGKNLQAAIADNLVAYFAQSPAVKTSCEQSEQSIAQALAVSDSCVFDTSNLPYKKAMTRVAESLRAKLNRPGKLVIGTYKPSGSPHEEFLNYPYGPKGIVMVAAEEGKDVTEEIAKKITDHAINKGVIELCSTRLLEYLGEIGSAFGGSEVASMSHMELLALSKNIVLFSGNLSAAHRELASALIGIPFNENGIVRFEGTAVRVDVNVKNTAFCHTKRYDELRQEILQTALPLGIELKPEERDRSRSSFCR